MNEYIICVAAFAGVAIGALSPYFRKNSDWAKWNHRYTLTALISAGIACLTFWDQVRQFALVNNDSIIGAFMFGIAMPFSLNEVSKYGPIKKLLDRIFGE